MDDQIGFQIQRQAERIEVARPDGGPVVVREGDFAMQRTAAIFVDLHAAFDEVVVEQVGAKLHNRNIRFALDDQLHPHPAPRGIAHRMQQTVAGEKIGVRDYHLPAGAGQHLQVVAFDIVAVILVIAPDEQRLRLAGGLVDLRLMATTAPPAAGGFAVGQILQFELQNIEHHRPLDLHRVILFGLRAIVAHMFGGVVDAADKGGGVVDHHDFTVHATEQVGTHSHQLRARVVIAENHPRGGQFTDKLIAKIRRAVAVKQHFHLDAAAGCLQQNRVQPPADLIFKPDKGFEDHPPAGATDGRKQRRIVLVAVLQ